MSSALPKHRGVPVRISDGLYADAKAQAQREFRTITGQLEYWARLGQFICAHPEVSTAEALRRLGLSCAPTGDDPTAG